MKQIQENQFSQLSVKYQNNSPSPRSPTQFQLSHTYDSILKAVWNYSLLLFTVALLPVICVVGPEKFVWNLVEI